MLGFLVLNCFIISLIPMIDAAVSYKGHQLWRVVLNKQKDLQVIRDLHKQKVLEISHLTLHKPSVFHVPQESLNFVRNIFSERRVPFEVTVDDLETFINDQKRRKRSVVTTLDDFTYQEYHTYEEIEQWIDLVAEQHLFAKKEHIGVTYEGRPIHMLKIQKDENSEKPAIYIDALTHAREWISTASLMYVVHEMLFKEENKWMTDELDWFIIPVVNVDGYVYTWTTDRNWRKTRSETATRAGHLCYGVDANRNWDNHWAEASEVSSCGIQHHGPFAASESEVRHLMNFIQRFNSKIKGLLSLHSYSELVLFPYGFDKATSANGAEQRMVGEKIAKAINDVHDSDYQSAAGAEGLQYKWSGNTMDWSYENAGIKFSYTIELRDKGKFKFFLPKEQIIPTGQELFSGIKVFARYISDNN